MEFKQYVSSYTLQKRSGLIGREMPREQHYKRLRRFGPEDWRQVGLGSEAETCLLEDDWYEQRCPYYKLYPGIIDALAKVRLDVPMELLKLPVDPLEIRFPESFKELSFSLNDKERFLSGMLFGRSRLRPVSDSFSAIINIVSETIDANQPVDYGFSTLSIYESKERNLSGYNYRKGQTVEEVLNTFEPQTLPGHTSENNKWFVEQCVRLLVGVCLIGKDSDILEPEVLSADQKKYEETLDPKYVEKAIRRGKYGWSLGKSLEKIPHYRRPHPAIYWTGKRPHQVPVLLWRAGSLVNRKVAEQIPTDYEE